MKSGEKTFKIWASVSLTSGCALALVNGYIARNAGFEVKGWVKPVRWGLAATSILALAIAGYTSYQNVQEIPMEIKNEIQRISDERGKANFLKNNKPLIPLKKDKE